MRRTGTLAAWGLLVLLARRWRRPAAALMDPDAKRTCIHCTAVMQWDSDRRVWAGEHAPECPITRAKQATEYENALRPSGGVAPHLDEVGVEDVIGPDSAPMWQITASTGRTVQGLNITDVFMVRALTYDGALLLAREMRPYIQDAEAVRVSA